nr:hypothetical protein [uncultured organism]
MLRRRGGGVLRGGRGGRIVSRFGIRVLCVVCDIECVW